MDNEEISRHRKWQQSLSRMLERGFNRLGRTQMIALGFLIIILTGTLCLMLPVASKDGSVTPFLDCLFTSVSATCVTGLVVVDTYRHWTIFGQLVILFLIQIGGLGFMSFLAMISIVAHRKIGLRERSLMSESVNAMQLGGIVRLMRRAVFGTFLVEGIGALILAFRFIPDLGFFRGIYYGVFHSISAFCNAGFDLMGYQAPYNSLCNYTGDWVINLTIIALIMIGGIGFIVWEDLLQKKWNWEKYRIHTKIVLVTTAILFFGGAILFYLMEKDGVLSGMRPGEKVLGSLFASATPRTAGFNTTDIAAYKDSTKLLNIILMFIGGSPGSTAGGIKTTTFVVCLLYVKANYQKTRGVNIFHRRLEEDAIKRASATVTVNLVLILTTTLIISATQNINLADIALETTSAMSTVGMSSGITRDLNSFSHLLLIFLMFSGRVGSLSVALSFTEKKKTEPFAYPEERVLIG
jgi:trk system potassium uptake protein TrkH